MHRRPAPTVRHGTFTNVKVKEKFVPREKFAAPVVEKKDNSMKAGETKVVRPDALASAT